MLEGDLFNPAILGTAPAVIQVFGTVLFCAVFLFLWRHSNVVYFGFWSLAWGIESLALAASFAAHWSGWAGFFWVRALLEFFFALALLIAARSAATATARGIRSSLRTMLLFPGLLLTIYLFAWRLSLPQFRVAHAAILASIYGYSFFIIGIRNVLVKGIGGEMLRFTLGLLFLEYIGHAGACGYVAAGGSGIWVSRLGWISLYDLIPQTLLAFSAMAMWIQTQQATIEQLRADLTSLEKVGSAELDHLTGLGNRMALDRHLDETFTGVVAVCDLDYFKDINDQFGHLVGDEVLRSVGHLIRASVRMEDEAFRWGGDEFVIVFRRQHLDLARGRMAVLEERLRTFRIRGHGVFPLGLSWGAAEGKDRPLRPVLEEADLQMYEHKRQAHARNTLG